MTDAQRAALGAAWDAARAHFFSDEATTATRLIAMEITVNIAALMNATKGER